MLERAGDRQQAGRQQEVRVDGSQEIMKARTTNKGLMERFHITKQESKVEERRGERWLSFI